MFQDEALLSVFRESLRKCQLEGVMENTFPLSSFDQSSLQRHLNFLDFLCKFYSHRKCNHMSNYHQKIYIEQFSFSLYFLTPSVRYLVSASGAQSSWGIPNWCQRNNTLSGTFFLFWDISSSNSKSHIDLFVMDCEKLGFCLETKAS